MQAGRASSEAGLQAAQHAAASSAAKLAQAQQQSSVQLRQVDSLQAQVSKTADRQAPLSTKHRAAASVCNIRTSAIMGAIIKASRPNEGAKPVRHPFVAIMMQCRSIYGSTTATHAPIPPGCHAVAYCNLSSQGLPDSAVGVQHVTNSRGAKSRACNRLLIHACDRLAQQGDQHRQAREALDLQIAQLQEQLWDTGQEVSSHCLLLWPRVDAACLGATG